MAIDDALRHPSADTLAAYVEGTLSPDDRTDVERHTAVCAECRDAIADTASFLMSEANADDIVTSGAATARVMRFRLRRLALPAGAVLAAAAALVIAVRFMPSPVATPQLRELVAAVAAEPTRLAEGRLTGGFPYAPPPSSNRGADGRAVSPDVRIAAARLEKAAEENASPEALAAFGVASLALGDLDRAVDFLDESARVSNSPSVRSDLAAALLARAAIRPEDAPRALAEAERALAAPESPIEAWFNRALALEKLGLRGEARRAWEAYLTRDADSPWADEARRFLQELGATGPSRTELNARIAALDPSDTTTFAATVDQYRQEVRELVEDVLFPAWGRSVLARRAEAGPQLLQIDALARELASLTGDGLLAGAAAAAAGGARLDALAAAHRDYGDGRRAYSEFRYADARPLFERAGQALAAAESPFSAWADVYLGILAYQARDFAAADARFARALDHGHASIAARVGWIRGLIGSEVGAYDTAIAEQRAALDLYTRLGENGNAAFIENLISETYRQLGERDLAWRHSLGALARLGSHSLGRTRASLLLTAGRSARDETMPEAALHFDEEASTAVQTDTTTACAQVQVRLAASYRELGRTADAGRALGRARDCLTRVTDGVAAQRLASEVLLEEALRIAGQDPAAAASALTASIGHATQLVLNDAVPRLLLERGRLMRRLDRHEDAARDFETGIERFERAWLLPRERTLRVSYFDESWRLFDELIALRAVEQGDPETALATVERARAGSAAASRGVRAATRGPRPVHVPPETAAIYYSTLPDRLLIWVRADSRTEFADVPVPRAQLEGLVDRLMREMAAGPATCGEAGERLFDVLIRPIAAHLAQATRLVLVPDGPLHRVPFACLIDDRTGRHLVESYTLSLSPGMLSASVPGSRVAGERRALAIAPPASRADDTPPPLPYALEEARAVAARFESAALLQGDDATADRVLELLPAFPVVHFAGHAIANPEFPGLSRLLLAPSAGTSAPGILTAERIGSLVLKDTALVVLSACSTAAGRVSRGQGMLGLAQPFLWAGAHAVVATLWDVDDFAAKHFFDEFYRRLAATGDAADALRRAQLALIGESDARLRSPRGWAAFTHYSETMVNEGDVHNEL